MRTDDVLDERTLIDGKSVITRSDSLEPLPALTVLSGRDRGQVHALVPGRTVVGRAGHAEVVLGDDSVSRRHCEFVIDEQGHAFVRDLGSTNGTRVGNEVVGSTPRRVGDGDRIRLSGSVMIKFSWQHPAEAELQSRLYIASVHDDLTGALNKRATFDRLEEEYASALQHGRPLSVLVVDLDEFKSVNDRFGHETGDRVLGAAAGYLLEQVRRDDVVGRFGGEEFVVLLRDTGIQAAARLGERIRAGLGALQVPHDGRSIGVTASIGAACSDDTEIDTPMGLFVRADREMYRAKQAGRNRVCFAQPAAGGVR